MCVCIACSSPELTNVHVCAHTCVVQGFEHRTSTSVGPEALWENDSFVFNVCDVTANITLLLFDDYALHMNK